MWSHSQHLVAVGTSWRGRGAPRWKSWRCFRGTASWTSDSARSPPRCPAFCSQGSAFPDCMGVAVHGSGVMHMRGRGACDLHKSQILFPAKKKKKDSDSGAGWRLGLSYMPLHPRAVQSQPHPGCSLGMRTLRPHPGPRESEPTFECQLPHWSAGSLWVTF